MQKKPCPHKKIPEQCPVCAAQASKDGALPSSAQLKTEIHQLHQKITRLTQKNPQKAAKILTQWMSEPAGKRASKKKSA